MSEERSTEREDRIEALRAAALRFTEQRGRWEGARAGRIRVAERGRLRAELSTRGHRVPWRTDVVRLHPNPYENEGYGLDIWVDGIGNVLRLVWDHVIFGIATFERGDWEEELLELASEGGR